jgi:nitroreductase
MEFSELVVKRRSIRKFKADAIAEQLINKVLEAGR